MAVAINTHSQPHATPPGFIALSEYQRVCHERDRYKEAVETLSQKLNEYQSWEEHRKKYERIPNQTLSAKATRFAVRLDERDKLWKKEGKTGPQPANLEDLSKELGFSKSAGREALNELATVGHSAISYGDPFEKKTKDGRTLVIEPLQIEVLGRAPDELARTPRGHGGSQCKSCPPGTGVRLTTETETSMIKRTTTHTKVTCQGCGRHVSTSTTTKDELAIRPKIDTHTHEFTENQIETSEPGDENPTENQIETRVEEDSNQLGTLRFINHSPPIDVSAVVDTENQIETSETATELLCSIAGDYVDEHIEMMRLGEKKYITVPGRVTPELAQRHIAGTVMLGSTLRHTDGTTRMMRWEADTPEGFAKLKEYAAALQRSGARVLLEDSPSSHHPGGGHIYLVFDRLVDAGRARATAEHYAPGLRGIGETWPKGGGRVRLPAGYYHRHNDKGWCAVWQLGGVKRTGDDAFTLLLTHQTPSTWATIAPTPPPQYRPRVMPKNKPWIRPTQHIPYGDRDEKLLRMAAAMRAKVGMEEEEIVDELRIIVDTCCAYVPEDPIKDSDLTAKARSAVKKYPIEGSGLHRVGDA